MIIYVIFMIMLFLLMGTCKVNQMRISNTLNNSINKSEGSICSFKMNRLSIFMFIAVLIVVLMSALRFDVGWDYKAYYDTIVFGRVTNIMVTKEYFTIFLVELAKKIRMPQFYFAINSIICICLIMATVKRYSKDFWISLFFFVSFPLFFLNSLSVVRNFSAIAITFYGFKYIEKGEFIKYILVVIIASLFHKTAIIAIIFYFLRNVHLNKFVSILTLITLPLLSNLIIKIIIRYMPRYVTYTSMTSIQEGTKAIYILLIIWLGAFIFKEKRIAQNSTFNMYYNIFFIGLCIYLMFFKQGTMGHRLSLYGTIYSLIIIPDIMESLKNKIGKVIIKSIFYLLCIVMFLYTINVGRPAYIPYKLFFNN